MSSQHILVVDESHKDRTALSKTLQDWGYHVTTVSDGYLALKKVKSESCRLVIASFETRGLTGPEFFEQAKSENESLEFLFLSADASVEDAVEMIKAGALDFLVKPVDPAQIRLIVKNVFESNGHRNGTAPQKQKTTRIVTGDSAMKRLLDLARQVSDSKASVLIQGESGTGKELFARFVHENSRRRNRPFVAVNCGALPESLLESELFGHEKGAFTGAVSRKPGKFEMADGGTLLLDEITEMAFHLQSKLLRVLQENEIDRVGGLRPIPIDIRVIATTNRDIKEAIEKKAFRADLFYRLNVIPIKIPALRFRKGDIPILVQHFIKKYNEIDRRNVKSLTNEATEKLTRFPFYGNVRELENITERAILLSDGEQIQPQDLLLDEGFEQDGVGTEDVQGPPSEMMTGPLKTVEKKLIFQTLDQTNGNRTHAAKMLGISVRTLRNKLNEYREKMDDL
jgi:two-component system, NtrC family, response regulator AtoC